MKYHLAQINIAQAKVKVDSNAMRGFVSHLDKINVIADAFTFGRNFPIPKE